MNEHLNTAARLHAAETERIEAEQHPPTNPTETLRRWIDIVATGATTVLPPLRDRTKQPRPPISPRLRKVMHWATNITVSLGALTVALALLNARLSWLILGFTLIAAGWSIVAIEELRDPEWIDFSGRARDWAKATLDRWKGHRR